MRTKLTERTLIEKAGSRFAAVRITKVGRSIEIRVRLATFKRRFEAQQYARERDLQALL